MNQITWLSVTTVVHTTGINWESVGTIGGFIVAAMAFLYAIQDRRSRQIKDDITDSVNNLSEVMLAKLETKENVTSLRLESIKAISELSAQVQIMQNEINRIPKEKDIV